MSPFLFLFPLALLLFFNFRVFSTAVAWHIVKFCFKTQSTCTVRAALSALTIKTFRKKILCCFFSPLSLCFQALYLPSQKHKRSTEHCLCNSIAIIQLRPPEGNTIKVAGRWPSAGAEKYFECFDLVLQM